MQNVRQATFAALIGSGILATLGVVYYQNSFKAIVPVILVHGFGGEGNSWIKQNYEKIFAENPAFQLRGNLRIGPRGAEIDPYCRDVKAIPYPCYTVSISDQASGDIRDSAKELAQFSHFVLRETHAKRLSLVGFSLGGVICREYLTSSSYQGEVKDLITISSPHLGSEFAALYDINRLLTARIRELELQHSGSADYSATLVQLCAASLRKANSYAAEHGVRLDSKALDMLHPPAAGNYLYLLNEKVHPKDVRYYSVITTKNINNLTIEDLDRDLKQIASRETETGTSLLAVTADLLRAIVARVSSRKESADYEVGDGFVAGPSQDMSNIQYFRERKQIIFTRSLNVDAPHLKDRLQKEFVGLILDRGT